MLSVGSSSTKIILFSNKSFFWILKSIKSIAFSFSLSCRAFAFLPTRAVYSAAVSVSPGLAPRLVLGTTLSGSIKQ